MDAIEIELEHLLADFPPELAKYSSYAPMIVVGRGHYQGLLDIEITSLGARFRHGAS